MADQRADQDLPITWTHPIGTRDGTLTTDALMTNCFVEKTETGLAAVKRPGTQYVSSVSPTGHAQGQFSYFNFNYFIVNDTIYPSSATVGVGIVIPGIISSDLAYFAISSDQAGAPLTTLQNEHGELWTFNGIAAVKVVDANYTSTQVSFGMAYLDGVYYAMRTDGQVIGSAINDPTTWPALDFAQADVTYGLGVSLIRHLNYVLAFYDKGLQVYWDANAAPNTQGIALLPALNASFRTGCFNARTIVELGDSCFFVSHNLQFGRQVQMMTGLALQVISTPYVEKILSQVGLQANVSTVWSFGITIAGHQFYGLTLSPLNVTLVYDVTNGVWNTWSSVVGGVEQYFTGRFYLGSDAAGSPDGDLFQDVVTGKQMQMLPTLYVDATGPMNVTCVTPPYDWNTSNYKRFNQMSQLSDAINTTVNISFSDNDYASFSTPRALGLMGPRSQLQRCGQSRRRIWKLFHQDNTPLRLYEMRTDMDIMSR
jgi:hypothetical protein